ncbi:MAG: M23 family metallopeptidase [Anaerolineales bacterium]|nr:M23 family metallopeptidase [Anaerolineales bacterium]
MEIPADFPPVGEMEGGSLIGHWTTLWSRTKDWVLKTRIQTLIAKMGDGPFLSRFTSHFIVILLAVSATVLSQVDVPRAILPGSRPTPTPASSLGFRLYAGLSARGGIRFQDEKTILPAPVPLTLFAATPTPPPTSTPVPTPTPTPTTPPTPTLPPTSTPTPVPTSTPTVVPTEETGESSRQEIITYVVQTGDTLYGIAEKFGISADTIMWASSGLEFHPDLLKIGQELTILPVDGVYHTVVAGNTLESIAQQYKAEVSAIIECEYNSLESPYNLSLGQGLIVPGGKKPYQAHVVHVYSGSIPEGASRGSGSFAWPASGIVTQGFKPMHLAIDIGAPTGTPIVAADSGYVVTVGWSEYGYGKYVVIDHSNGFQTLYSHLHTILVEVGQSVGKGERIGSVGITGRATGPHLHFEIRYGGVQRNPFGYLP